MSRDQNRESVVQEGTGSTYQSTGTFSHNVCHLDICQNVENVSYMNPARQHDSLESYLLKMGGTKNPKLMQISNGISEFLLGQGITITAEHLPGNLNCKADWESDFQQNMPNIGKETRNRPVCFKVVKPTSKLLLLETESQQS